MRRYLFYNSMSREDNISLLKTHLDIKDLNNHMLDSLKEIIENVNDPDKIIQLAELYFKILKKFTMFEDIVSLTFTADAVHIDTSG